MLARPTDAGKLEQENASSQSQAHTAAANHHLRRKFLEATFASQQTAGRYSMTSECGTRNASD